MRLADQMLLAQIREALLGHIPDQQWALVEQEVETAGGVDKVDGYTGVLLRDAIQKAKKNKVETVMSEFKAGKLKSSSGKKVKSRKQAIAIALSEQRRVKKEMLEKASFGGDRSAAGRYAALQRWKGRVNEKGSDGARVAAAGAPPSNPPNGPSGRKAANARWKQQTTASRVNRNKSLSDIASELKAAYRKQGKKIPPALAPYLDAMLDLNTIDDNYGMDSGRMIVGYFLSNLRGLKNEGGVKELKSELMRRIKEGESRDEQTVQSDKPSGDEEVYDTKRDEAVYRKLFGAKKPLAVDSRAAKPARDQVDRIKDEVREVGDKGSWRGTTKQDAQQDLEDNIKALGEIDSTKRGSLQQRRDILSQIGRARAIIAALEEIEDETSPGYFAS